jgi:hypothetical protein
VSCPRLAESYIIVLCKLGIYGTCYAVEVNKCLSPLRASVRHACVGNLTEGKSFVEVC